MSTVWKSTTKRDHEKKISWNQFFTNFFCKNVDFTEKMFVKIVITFHSTFSLFQRVDLTKYFFDKREFLAFPHCVPHIVLWIFFLHFLVTQCGNYGNSLLRIFAKFRESNGWFDKIFFWRERNRFSTLTVHSMKITKIYSHAFVAKISWNQHIYYINY